MRSFKNEQFIRYMGSKRGILDHIIPILLNERQSGKYVLDIMAGTHAIGYALKSSDSAIPVIANDCQSYSAVIGKALLENNTLTSITAEEAEKDLQDSFLKNKHAILSRWSIQHITKNQYRTDISASNEAKLVFPQIYALFTFYFSGVYFSVSQAIELDSLRYAIDKIADENKKNVYLSCLLYAASYGSSSFGHFAQPRRVTKEVKKLQRRSIYTLFLKRLSFLQLTTSPVRNYVFNNTFDDLIMDKNFEVLKKSIGLVYLDPPYSSANYSRFYHLLETLIHYDFPENKHKGLYRNDRFISEFTKLSKVEDAFRKVIKFSYDLEANLVISYSNTGLLTENKIKRLCKEYYTRPLAVRSHKKIHHLHSTQGNRKKNGVFELVITCTY